MTCFRSKLVCCGCIAMLFLTGFRQQPPKTYSFANKQAAEAEGAPKKLDLSLPTGKINFDEPPQILASSQSVLPGVEINHNKSRPLELQGKVIMSQELEAGKTRSADGAGIQINLRH
jgi:hypothetical protein